MSFDPIFGLEGRFALIAGALCRAVAACLGRLDGTMIILICQRVRRTENRLRALAERVRLGVYRGGCAGLPAGLPQVTRDARVARGKARVRPVAGVWGHLPRRFGWLIRLAPFEIGGYASQLACVLAEPEMVTLLRDVPQARRIVRPTAGMLGLVMPGEPVGCSDPGDGAVRPARVRAARVRATRAPVARTKLDFGRIPLPRGVLSAARRQGYGKLS